MDVKIGMEIMHAREVVKLKIQQNGVIGTSKLLLEGILSIRTHTKIII
jgi:hypothetical protein